MVVDDMPGNRIPLARFLKMHGFETLCAASGYEALDLLNEQTPRVMLLDLMMPGMDGFALLKALREDPDWKSLPVVVLTATNDDQSRRRVRELGAQGYLVKANFTLTDVLDQVRRYAC